ncbi:MAG TPA: hypothetical protein VLB76_29785 [Thermoanaerobaculia bacterium]|jgi:hypothetical protein|nr:hypothetical protein [Thermoanaerobaculia bacterium]
MLAALQSMEAVFLVVGAHAMAAHGVPRATGDFDIWVRPDPENSRKVFHALVEFGAPLEASDLRVEDLAKPGTVYQIGLPPRRIDLLTEIDGVEFDEAWQSKTVGQVFGLEVPFLGWEALLRNKKAAGRPKDLADVKLLEAKDPPRS